LAPPRWFPPTSAASSTKPALHPMSASLRNMTRTASPSPILGNGADQPIPACSTMLLKMQV
jgi:hypothetical protein